MSALGQKRTFRMRWGMSDFGPKADLVMRGLKVRSWHLRLSGVEMISNSPAARSRTKCRSAGDCSSRDSHTRNRADSRDSHRSSDGPANADHPNGDAHATGAPLLPEC